MEPGHLDVRHADWSCKCNESCNVFCVDVYIITVWETFGGAALLFSYSNCGFSFSLFEVLKFSKEGERERGGGGAEEGGRGRIDIDFFFLSASILCRES